jgi:two-component system, LytTR family, response regulator
MQKQFRALIVDDERLSRKELVTMLSGYEKILVVGEAEDVPSAMKAIKELNPDVIFLDIQMPGQSGFELIENSEIDTKIIFVTAYDEFAIRAFEVNALDYLLKPVNPERLRNSIERLEISESIKVNENKKINYQDRLFLLINSHYKFLKVNSVLSITSAGDYTEILTTDGLRGLTHKSMAEWEQRLPENYFCRIHRSTIINMEYIERTEEWFNQSLRIYVKGVQIPFVMSRRYAAKIKDRFA